MDIRKKSLMYIAYIRDYIYFINKGLHIPQRNSQQEKAPRADPLPK